MKATLPRLLASVAGLLLLGAGCLGRPTPTPTLAPAPTAAPTATATASSAATVAAAPALEAALTEIEGQVARLRGLSFTAPVPRLFLDEAGLRREMEREFNKADNREIMAREEALYKALGLIPRSLDYLQLNLDLYTEQVLGFYDTEDKRLVVVQRGRSFGPVEKVTFSHELTHALQQQHFDINGLIEASKRQRDASIALSALVEGDAVLLQQRYMATVLSPTQQGQFYRDSAGPYPVFDSAALVVRESLVFPYSAGTALVASVQQSGGWTAVDRLYTRPPVSSEQVLHPQKYLADERPKEMALPDVSAALGAGWKRLDQDTLGEFYLRTYLRQRLDINTAAAAAEGWGGDRYEVWSAGPGQDVFVMLTDWDTEADAREFFAAYAAFADAEGGAGSRVNAGQGNTQRTEWSSAAGRILLSLQGTRVLVLRSTAPALMPGLLDRFLGF